MNYLSAHTRGFTLIEILVVVAITALLIGGGITAFTTAHENQLVRQSAEMVADTFQRASIYSQNVRNERTWGVKSDDQKGYVIFSQQADGTEYPEMQTVQLPGGIQFTQPFHIIFTRGTGYVDNNIQVVVTSQHNVTNIISLYTTGSITVTSP